MPAVSDESVARERYERHAMAASELPAAAVQPFEGDAEALLTRVRGAVQAVTRDRAAIRRRLPKSRFDTIRVLPEIAMALHHAATRMALPETAPPEVTGRLNMLHGALRPTLAAAEVCLTRSLVPETYALVRRAIVAGDPASAAATITDLLQDRWRHVQSRVSLTQEEIARVNEPAKWLLSNTRPADRMDSRDIRDRLWSILRDRYEQLRAIAQELHGSDFESYAPPLVPASPP
jgi:hypothetical protein